MPTNTYVALDKVTVGTATNSITFSSINQGYTDLVIVTDAGASVISEVDVRVGNSSVDTGSNYSRTVLSGDGSSATSVRNSSQTYWRPNYNSVYDNANGKSNHIFHFMNYSNTNVFKTMLYRGNSAAYGVDASVNLWRSTSAINVITLYANVAGTKNFLAGSTFSLYGIAATSVGAKATGGIISSDSQYYYHTFLSSDTFTPTQSLTCDYLVVAGGGGGGAGNDGGGGGGGAGGYRTSIGGSALSLTATGYTVTVGAGGTGASGQPGTKGSNSVFSTITSTGGGRGGYDATSGAGIGGSGGGSGAGTSNGNTAGTGNEGGYTPVEGYAGGVNFRTTSPSFDGEGGGGGGSAAVGTAGTAGTRGAGGNAATNSITGTSVAYAGGGSGGSWYSGTAGGGTTGGGGVGGAGLVVGGNGTANTGGGGGGGGQDRAGGAGGSGIVIVRYAK